MEEEDVAVVVGRGRGEAVAPWSGPRTGKAGAEDLIAGAARCLIRADDDAAR